MIYDRNKADVKISAPIKIYAPKLCVHQNIGAQTLHLLTIWARQNLQLLTSSKSCWRALIQVMLPLVHAVLKWLVTQAAQLISAASLPYCTGCCTGITCQNICAWSKYLRAHIFSPFLGKSQKSISASKCPITAPKILTWSQKLSKFSCNTFKPLNRGRPRFWPRSPEMTNFQQWGVRGWGRGGLMVHRPGGCYHIWRREWEGGGEVSLEVISRPCLPISPLLSALLPFFFFNFSFAYFWLAVRLSFDKKLDR
jgi:hypothetical protein